MYSVVVGLDVFFLLPSITIFIDRYKHIKSGHEHVLINYIELNFNTTIRGTNSNSHH